MSIGLGLSGPDLVQEGDYTLTVATDGPAAVNPTDVTVSWGDGFQTLGQGAGDYTHSILTTGFNYEGNVPLADYTITTQAVARSQQTTSGQSFVSDATVDASGRRITVGGNLASDRWEIRRFAADGSPDASFGNAGLVTVDFGIVGTDNARSVAVDASGKIVVAGSSTAVNQFIVARFNDNGSLDSGNPLTDSTPGDSFGTGSLFGVGIVTTAIGPSSEATSLAIQPDGKIVVGGNSGSGNFALARYLSSGSLDGTFGGGGTVTTAFGGVSPLTDLALRTVGSTTTRIVAVGHATPGSIVAAYTGAGALDVTFDGDGKRTGDVNATTTAVTVQDDGSVIVGGTVAAGTGPLVLLKLTSAGQPDSGFGAGGAAVHSYQPTGGGDYAVRVASLIVQDDLSIVAGGTLSTTTPSGDAGLGIFRFDSQGNVDAAFGQNGLVYTPGGSSLSAVSGGHVTLNGDTLVQSGTVQDGPGAGANSDAIGVYTETATFAVAVTNVAPSTNFAPFDPDRDALFGFPTSNLPTAVPGQAAWFALEATDPSLEDFNFLTYEIDWGDGTSDTFNGAGTYDFSTSGGLFDNPFYTAHLFEASGNLTVTLRVSDEDGGFSVATFAVNVAASSGVVQDPANPGQTALFIAAPRNGQTANTIQVKSTTASSEVKVDGVTTLYGPADRIVVYGNVGNDTLQVNGGIMTAKLELYGGPGNDKLKGGNLADALVGGDGEDLIVGGAGRDLLVGGRQADKIVGESDDDILIGAVYTEAGSRDAIAAVMAEWTSTGSYTDRVTNLRLGGGANGAVRLVGHDVAEEEGFFQTVIDDMAVDKLTGDAGQDWFFANDESALGDRITDLNSNEFSDDDRLFALS